MSIKSTLNGFLLQILRSSVVEITSCEHTKTIFIIFNLGDALQVSRVEFKNYFFLRIPGEISREDVLPSHTVTGYCIACHKNTKTNFQSHTQFFNTYFPVILSHSCLLFSDHRNCL